MKAMRLAVSIFLLMALPFCGKNPVGPLADEERILFIRSFRGNSAICTMKPDGTDLQVIAPNDKGDDYSMEGYSWARWSPDKTMLVIQGGPPGLKREYKPILTMNTNGVLLDRLTSDGFEPHWASENTVIFTRHRGYFSLVFEIDVHTHREDSVLVAEVGPPGTYSGNIYWLLDVFKANELTKLLLLVVYTYTDSSGKAVDEDSELLIYDVANKEKFFLTDNDIEEGCGSVSPGGEFVAFTRKNPGTLRYTSNLFMMTSKGESIKKITTGTSYTYSRPMWSPDGEKIVFTKADQSEHYTPYNDLFILDISTGAVSQLTNTAKDSIRIKIMEWR